MNIDEETYNQAKNNELRLISPLSNVQLIKLSSYKLSDAITKKSITANISSFSTANYALADLNNNGVVSTIEWQAYQGSQQKDLINKNLIKFATVITSVIDKPVTLKTANPLSWLAALKIPANWNQWYNQHQQAFDTAWQTNINNQQLTLEAKRYLISDSKQLNDYTQAEIVKPPQYTAACQLNISVDEPSFESTKVEVGQTWQLSSQVTDSVTGSLISEEPNWKSLNSTLARVSNSGVLDSLAAGSTEIMASYKLGTSICTDSLAVTITDTQQPEPAKLTSIAIGAIPATLVEKESISLNVMGSMSDKSVHNITDKVTWTAIPATTVRFDSNSLVALKTGKVTIAAGYGGFSDTKTFIIEQAKPLPPKLTTIRIDGYNESKLAGESWQLEAFGLFSDKSVSDLSSKVDWQSSNIEVATVANGLVTAKAEGTAIITVSLDGISEKQHVTVTAAEPIVERLTILGSFIDLNKGDEVNISTYFSVFTEYNDETLVEVTHEINWAQSDNTIVSITGDKLRALTEGTFTLTATWHQPNGKKFNAKRIITVLPAKLVSANPDILSGTFTMKEGEQYYNKGLKLTFSDNTEIVYTDVEVSYIQDKSGLPIAKFDITNNTIRALRAGEVFLTFKGVPPEILNEMDYSGLSIDYNHGTVTAKLIVEENPNVYQWHRSLTPAPVGDLVVNIQNITYNNVVYRFWKVLNDRPIKDIHGINGIDGVYLTTFDGKTHTNPIKILPDRTLTTSNGMVDGGGHGYSLLISQDANRNEEYYIYRLPHSSQPEGSLHKINFTGAPFDNIQPDKERKAFAFNNDGNLLVLLNKRTAYTYNQKTQQWKQGHELTGSSDDFTVVQLPSHTEHLVIFDSNGNNNITPPKYHFINRTTGEIDNVAQINYPDIASISNSQCMSITIIPNNTIDSFGAFCTAYSNNMSDRPNIGLSMYYYTGYWLWDNINHPPQIYNTTSDEVIIEVGQPIAAKGINDQIIATDGYIDKVDIRWNTQINESSLNSDPLKITRLSGFSHNEISPSYNIDYPLVETGSMLIENPNVISEQLLMTQGGIVIKSSEDATWNRDLDMYETPHGNGHLFQLNNTWHIFYNHNNQLQKDRTMVWSFQMRNPNQALAQ